MEQAYKHQINIKCFVSDSAGEYASARIKKYKEISTKAIQIVSLFHMASYFAVIGSTHQCANLRRTTTSTHDKFLPADIVQVVNELPDSEFSLKIIMVLKHFIQLQSVSPIQTLGNGKYPFDPSTVKQFRQDIMSFWELCSGHIPELSRLALHLYHSVCVNAVLSLIWFGVITNVRDVKLISCGKKVKQ
ncbi:unnamed protein product [Rhizophagus irregularis]|nr:unnamed protein product [Rhizophagus irregularis]